MNLHEDLPVAEVAPEHYQDVSGIFSVDIMPLEPEPDPEIEIVDVEIASPRRPRRIPVYNTNCNYIIYDCMNIPSGSELLSSDILLLNQNNHTYRHVYKYIYMREHFLNTLFFFFGGSLIYSVLNPLNIITLGLILTNLNIVIYPSELSFNYNYFINIFNIILIFVSIIIITAVMYYFYIYNYNGINVYMHTIIIVYLTILHVFTCIILGCYLNILLYVRKLEKIFKLLRLEDINMIITNNY